MFLGKSTLHKLIIFSMIVNDLPKKMVENINYCRTHITAI